MPSLGSALDRLGQVDTRSREPLVLSIVGVVKNDPGDVADSIGTEWEPGGVHSKPVGSAIFFRTWVPGELSHLSYRTSYSVVGGLRIHKSIQLVRIDQGTRNHNSEERNRATGAPISINVSILVVYIQVLCTLLVLYSTLYWTVQKYTPCSHVTRIILGPRLFSGCGDSPRSLRKS